MKSAGSKNNGIKTTAGLIGIVVAVMVSASPAYAQSELELISGLTTVVVPGNVNGVATAINQTVGSWTVYSAVGLASPSETANTINLNSLDVTQSGTSTPLEVLFSADGFTQTGGYTVNYGGTLTSGMAITLSSYYGALASTATPLAGAVTYNYSGGSSFSGANIGTASGPTPFAVTEEAVITGATAPDSEISFSETISPVPEPSTIVLLAGGAIAFIVAYRDRKRHA